MSAEPVVRPTRLLPPVWLLSALGAMLLLHFLLPIATLLSWPWRWSGLPPASAGAALVLWPAVLFRAADTTIVPFRESSALVVRGPYRFTRNPIYLGMVVFLFGVALLLGSASPFAVIPPFWLVLDRRFVRAEEAMLRLRFGAEFDAYCARVRRWL
jgi:protein-S-isoprenylcysteine O-methyltransferase Ste14